MKAELKKYQTCPDCGKKYKDNPEYKKFDMAFNRVKEKIEFNRELPPDDFKKWLIDERKFYANEVQSMLIFITSPLNVDQKTFPVYWSKFIGKDASEDKRMQMTLKGGYYKVNFDAYLVLNFNYDCIDIIDQELYGKKAEAWTFPEYLINVSESFAVSLKEKFKADTGQQISYMVEALKELNLLVIPNGKTRKFHESLKIYFNSDIGTYNGIFSSKIILRTEKIQDAKKRIQSIT